MNFSIPVVVHGWTRAMARAGRGPLALVLNCPYFVTDPRMVGFVDDDDGDGSFGGWAPPPPALPSVPGRGLAYGLGPGSRVDVEQSEAWWPPARAKAIVYFGDGDGFEVAVLETPEEIANAIEARSLE